MLKHFYIQLIRKVIIVCTFFSIFSFSVNSNAQSDTISIERQNQLLLPDSVTFSESDTLKQSVDSTSTSELNDTTSAESSTKINRNSYISSTQTVMEEDVTYYSEDSTVIMADGTVVMYNNAMVTYGDTKLEAYYIRMNRDSNMIYAEGIRDSSGALTQTPVFSDGTQTFKCETVRYNFKTGKGLIFNVASEQAEGYVTGGVTKRVDEESFCMKNGRYTTCSNVDHPHFYLKMSKAKVHPGKYIATGPAWLVMEDVPLPIFIPFGYFPFTSTYSSGFIMPSYSEESTRGFNLQGGGYYFALSDYMDLALTGDIFTNGSWAVYAQSRYKKRYKFNGNFKATYRINISGDKDIDMYSKNKDFSVVWSHAQDSKASQYSSFSASVNFSSSSYETNDINRLNTATASNNHKSSSISYSKRFPNAPFIISLSANASQNASDSSVTVSLPNLNVSMNRIYPFKRKHKSGSDRWYEKIGLSYTGSTSNSYSGPQDDLFTSNIVKDWRNGMKHSIPVSTSFQLFNNITVSPSVSYTERWYTYSVKQSWDSTLNAVQRDTSWDFNRVYDYSTSMSFSTKLYGMYTPAVKMFGGKVQAVRHVITPSVSFSWRPDFAQDKYGYYDTYEKYNKKDSTWSTVQYSKYAGSLYGTPGSGKNGSIGLSLGNNLEMKVLNTKDTTSQYRKISLIDRLNFSTSYNMMADSLNWNDISALLSFKVFKKSFNVRATFDPYSYDNDGKKINTYYLKDHGKLAHLTRVSTSLSMSLNNEKIKKIMAKLSGAEGAGAEGEGNPNKGAEGGGGPNNGPGDGKGGGEEGAPAASFDQFGYQKFSIPWTLSLGYSVSVNSVWDDDIKDFKYEGNSNLSISGSVTLTEKWGTSFSSGYNFKTQKIASTRFSITRDLHCWSMSASFVPIGTYKSYTFSIHVNSSMLQDLKYDKRNSASDRSLWD